MCLFEVFGTVCYCGINILCRACPPLAHSHTHTHDAPTPHTQPFTQDGDETGIDCGGSCNACELPECCPGSSAESACGPDPWKVCGSGVSYRCCDGTPYCLSENQVY